MRGPRPRTAPKLSRPKYTLTPCRAVDTRSGLGGTSLAANGTSSARSVPATAQPYLLNVTVVPPGPLSYLTAWAAGQTQPMVSANATDVILDINAYFAQ